MEEFTVNKNSWHYRLNSYILSYKPFFETNSVAKEMFIQSKDNFCAYFGLTFRNILTGVFALSLVLFMLGMVLVLLGGYGYLWYTHPMDTLILTLIPIGIVSFTLAATYLVNKLEAKRRLKLDKILYEGETETSFARAKYNSWKTGVCIPVKFK